MTKRNQDLNFSKDEEKEPWGRGYSVTSYSSEREVLGTNQVAWILHQPRPQGLLLVQTGGRRNPWPRLLKYSTNRGVFCHVTHDEMAFSEVVSSVLWPCLFSAIGNRYSNKTKTFHRVCVTKF